MSEERVKRKLSAILSADVVGYSRMMEVDEAWTIKSLEESKKLMSSLIDGHNGRVVDAPGDNLLAEFSSVINAVECAVEIQKELNNKNSRLMEEHRMHFRIGVNLGDVVEEEDRIYGNGVNIAARLEGLAEPGGICISGTTYDHVIPKLNLEYEYLGEHNVKNIATPVRVYRVLMGTETSGKGIGKKRFLGRITIVNFIIWITVAVILTGFIVGFLNWKLGPEPSLPLIRLSHELPKDQQFRFLVTPTLAVSPDGKHIVYSTQKGLFLRSTDELSAHLIAGTEGSSNVQPFFSPDGEWIGYFSINEQQLKKISINGGAPVRLCKIGMLVGASWGEDGTIVYGTQKAGGMKISDQGGTSKNIIGKDIGMIGLPQVLPGGKSVLFTALGPQPMIMVKGLESADRKELFPGNGARYIPTGHIVYTVDNNLFAVPFDPEKLEVIDEHILLEEGIFKAEGLSQFTVSDAGTLAFIPTLTNTTDGRTLVWANRKGEVQPIVAEPKNYRFPKISPDGTKLALTVEDGGNWDIWVWDFSRENQTRLTFEAFPDLQAIWTPDSKKIVFWSTRNGGGIYQKSADGTGKVELVISSPESGLYPFSWSADGDRLVLGTQSVDAWDIAMLSMAEGKKLHQLLQTQSTEIEPVISPDGKWMAYVSDESGNGMNVFVRPFPDIDEGKWQISTNGGESPLWSPDSSELFYIVDGLFMVVSLETEPTFKPGRPEILISGMYISGVGEGIPWDIHPDGNRFLLIATPGSDAFGIGPRRINIVLNWFEELKQRVPVD
jgi:class 3 adenylate cyclase/Tol biopolymer transport system component